jgi:hypothetical protein
MPFLLSVTFSLQQNWIKEGRKGSDGKWIEEAGV